MDATTRAYVRKYGVTEREARNALAAFGNRAPVTTGTAGTAGLFPLSPLVAPTGRTGDGEARQAVRPMLVHSIRHPSSWGGVYSTACGDVTHVGNTHVDGAPKVSRACRACVYIERREARRERKYA